MSILWRQVFVIEDKIKSIIEDRLSEENIHKVCIHVW